jgi:hypothetical protein
MITRGMASTDDNVYTVMEIEAMQIFVRASPQTQSTERRDLGTLWLSGIWASQAPLHLQYRQSGYEHCILTALCLCIDRIVRLRRSTPTRTDRRVEDVDKPQYHSRVLGCALRCDQRLKS